MKKIVIVSSTFRKNGNSELLAKSFAEGAISMGNEVQFIFLRDLDLQYCIGCLYCQSHQNCVLKDGMNELYHKFEEADVLVFATPIYYYAMSGQLKTLLDRLNPLYPRRNNFKEVYLLATSADDKEEAMNVAVQEIEGWISCFNDVKLKGVLRGVAVTDVRDVEKTSLLKRAFELGKNV